MNNLHTREFVIFVPRPGTTDPQLRGIAPGSAIVAAVTDIVEPDLIEANVGIYFEGNLIGASNLERFAERAHIAASRSAHRYGTMGRGYVSEKELVEVGRYDYHAGEITAISRPDLLADYLGSERLPQVGEGWRFAPA